MNILIFGATGPTGRELVQQALAHGHVVTAFARNPAAIAEKHERLKVVKGDILDGSSVEAAVRGQEAVLLALGVRKWGKNTILSDGTRNIIEAMKRLGVRRLVCMTSLGVGDSKGQPAWFFNWIILPLLLRNVFADKQVQEQYVTESGLDWTIVRPVFLTNRPRTGAYRHWVGQPPPSITGKISRADVADFMLAQVADKTYLHKAPGLSY